MIIGIISITTSSTQCIVVIVRYYHMSYAVCSCHNASHSVYFLMHSYLLLDFQRTFTCEIYRCYNSSNNLAANKFYIIYIVVSVHNTMFIASPLMVGTIASILLWLQRLLSQEW